MTGLAGSSPAALAGRTGPHGIRIVPHSAAPGANLGATRETATAPARRLRSSRETTTTPACCNVERHETATTLAQASPPISPRQLCAGAAAVSY